MPTLITTAGATNANSYASLSSANSYHSDRSNTAWATASEAERESALIRATDYLDSSYVFVSVKVTEEQALENPRYPDATIHPKIERATIALALELLTENPFANQSEERAIKTKDALEGVGSKEVEYDTLKQDPFPFISKLLRGVATRLSSSAGTVKMVNP